MRAGRCRPLALVADRPVPSTLNYLVCNRYYPRVPGVTDPPEYTVLDGDTTNISCKDVTQT